MHLTSLMDLLVTDFFFIRRITPDNIYYGRFAGSTQIYTIEGSTLEQEQ